MVTDTGLPAEALTPSAQPQADDGGRRASHTPNHTRNRAPKLRRRGLAGLSLAVIAVAILGNVMLIQSVTTTTPVLAVAGDTIHRGELITEADLAVVDITTDPGLRTIPSGDLDTVVGQRASTDIAAGALLTPGALTTSFPPAEGEALVGLSVRPDQLPVRQLLPGDRILVVDTPRANDDPPADPPRQSDATVVSFGDLDETGHHRIDVVVPAQDASVLAARAATGRIAIVLQPREQG